MQLRATMPRSHCIGLNARYVINFPGNLAPRPLLCRYYFPGYRRALQRQLQLPPPGGRPQCARLYKTRGGQAKFVETVTRTNVAVINRNVAIMADNKRPVHGPIRNYPMLRANRARSKRRCDLSPLAGLMSTVLRLIFNFFPAPETAAQFCFGTMPIKIVFHPAFTKFRRYRETIKVRIVSKIRNRGEETIFSFFFSERTKRRKSLNFNSIYAIQDYKKHYTGRQWRGK